MVICCWTNTFSVQTIFLSLSTTPVHVSSKDTGENNLNATYNSFFLQFEYEWNTCQIFFKKAMYTLFGFI